MSCLQDHFRSQGKLFQYFPTDLCHTSVIRLHPDIRGALIGLPAFLHQSTDVGFINISVQNRTLAAPLYPLQNRSRTGGKQHHMSRLLHELNVLFSHRHSAAAGNQAAALLSQI